MQTWQNDDRVLEIIFFQSILFNEISQLASGSLPVPVKIGYIYWQSPPLSLAVVTNYFVRTRFVTLFFAN